MVFYNISREIRLTPAHLWVSLMPSGQARVGLDPLVRAAMGEPDTIDAPVSGTRVRKGQALFSARWGGRSVMFPSPVEGTVQAACPTDGGLDNDAWVLTLQPEHAKSDLDTLPLAEEAVRWFAGEWERLRAFVAGGGLQAVPAMAMPDGGKPAPGWMKLEPDETWDRFVDTFLRPEEPHAH